MPVRVVGVSFEPERLQGLDAAAEADNMSRSAWLARLVDQELQRRKDARGDAPLVVVDGVRYVPERKRVKSKAAAR